jgi:hypothetical protein
MWVKAIGLAMKSRLLPLIVLTIGLLCSTPVKADDVITLSLIFDSPLPVYDQIEYGKIYTYYARVENNGLNIEEGTRIDFLIPNARFSGKIIIDTSITILREGIATIGNQKIPFTKQLERGDFSDRKDLPGMNTSISKGYIYGVTKNYDDWGVEINDWITFNIDIAVSLEGYKELGGSIIYLQSIPIATVSEKYHILTDEKLSYVDNIYSLLSTDYLLAQTKILEIEGQTEVNMGISLNEFYGKITQMNTSIQIGNYVKAMKVYADYEPTWKDDIINGLTTTYVDTVNNFTETLIDMTLDQFNMESTLNETISRLETQVSQLDSTNRILLSGVGILALVMAGIAFVAFRKPGSLIWKRLKS